MRLFAPLVPRHRDEVLRVICPGRISTPDQDIEAIASSQDESERWLRMEYQGRTQIVRLGEQASGWLADRESIHEAKRLIVAGECDLVLCAELREVFRNPAFIWGFVHFCIDKDVRFIAFANNVDTANPDWELSMHTAVLLNGLAVPETRRRVRRKATHAFAHGGMVMKSKYGYRKLTKEEAASGEFGPVGLRIAKLPECTPVIRELVRRALRGDGPPALARYLNESGVATGKYATSRTWTSRLVLVLLRDLILSGRRTFRQTISQLVFETGKHRVVPNPDGPEIQEYPELAHITVAEHDQLLEALDARRKRSPNPKGPPGGRDNPLWGRPRTDSLWPGQHANCSVCDGRMYRLGNFLRCQNSVDDSNRQCWNAVQARFDAILPRVLRWVVDQVECLPGFRERLVEAVWAELQAVNRRNRTALTSDERTLKDRQIEAKRLAKAIRSGGKLEALVDELKTVAGQIAELKQKLRGHKRQQHAEAQFTSRESVSLNLFDATMQLARTSREFAGLLRRLLPRFVIAPVQALDCPQVRPRAHLTLSLAAWANDGETIPTPASTSINLFDPPVHVQYMPAVLAVREASPKVSYRKIAAQLGIGYMTVKRAFAYSRLMTKAGLTDPYRELTSEPTNASRWRSRESNPEEGRPAA